MIDAGFLNNLEVFCNSAGWFDSLITSDHNGGLQCKNLQASPTTVVVNGNTSGTATIYQAIRGTGLIITMCWMNNFRNNSATEQYASLPVAYTTRAFFYNSTGMKAIHLSNDNGSTNLSGCFNVLTALGASGGTSANQSTPGGGDAIGQVGAAFNAIGLTASDSSASTGFTLFVGW